EGRILLPKEMFFSGATGSSNLTDIQAQEAGFIKETERKIARFRFLERLAVVVGGALLIYSLIHFIRRLINFWKTSRDLPIIKPNLAGTLWEPPSELS